MRVNIGCYEELNPFNLLDKPNKIMCLMRNYIITYSYPQKYRGTYLVQGKDSIEAGNKLSAYLKETFGETESSHSIVVEVEGSSIQIIGYRN